jgi:hypothetical protein
VPQCGSLSHAFCARLGDPSGLAVAHQYLYASGASASGEEVLQYALPLRKPELPSGSVTGLSKIDVPPSQRRTERFTILQRRRNRRSLLAAAYAEPTAGIHDQHSTTVQRCDWCRRRSSLPHLYVSLFTLGRVYDYKLPYRLSEPPTILQVNPYRGPYGITVGDDHLFVTDGTAGAIEAYPLPLTPMSIPDAIVPFADQAPA